MVRFVQWRVVVGFLQWLWWDSCSGGGGIRAVVVARLLDPFAAADDLQRNFFNSHLLI